VDRVDVEGNAHSGQHIKLPFASLFDTLGTWVSCFLYMCLTINILLLRPYHAHLCFY
jgi:hypothetical protein